MNETIKIAIALECAAKYRETGGNDLINAVVELRRLAAVESELEALKASLGEPVAWRYKTVAVVDGVRVPVREVDTARNEYTITQQQPHDWSHLDYPLDYPTYEDHEPLYAITKDKP